MGKYIIKFMPDYYTTSLWPVNDIARSELGSPIEYGTVKLSEELIERLIKFDDKIVGLIDWSDPGGPSPLTMEEQMQIYDEGVILLDKVRKELGDDYEVIDELGWIFPKEK